MKTDKAFEIIQCACGQRMRLPAESTGRVFKCVKCGALVERAAAGGAKTDAGSLFSAQSKELLASIFIEAGLITREQAQTAMRDRDAAHEKFFETLIRLEFISKEQLHSYLSHAPGIATINLAHFSIDRRSTELLPVDVILRHWVLPMDQMGRSVTVAMVCPLDAEAISVVEKLTGFRARPMLCTLDDFLTAVRKHYRVPGETEVQPGDVAHPAYLRREGIVTDAAKEKNKEKGKETRIIYPGNDAPQAALEAFERFPIPARVMNQLDAVVGVEGDGLRQVVAIAAASPQFAAILLGTANTSAYGVPGRVDSVPMAVAILGEEAVALLAANAQKLSSANERQWFHLSRFSRHCADIAALLATECGRIVPNVAYCAALLHSVGSYALGEIDPEEYRKIDPRLTGVRRLRAETQVFGIGHAEAGGVLCARWNIPDIVREGIRHYPDPAKSEDYKDIAYVLWIAAQLAGSESEVRKDGISDCQEGLAFLHLDPKRILQALLQAVPSTPGT